MFKSLKKWVVRGLIYSTGLSLFLSQHWIDPAGSWFQNILAGFVLYTVAFIVPNLLVRG